MRKVDPTDVRGDFESASKTIVDHFDRLVNSLASSTTKEGDTSQLATQSFLALFVAFERFTSDLILAYLNRDFSAYQADLQTRLNSSIEDRFGSGVFGLVTIKKHEHAPVATIEAIVDPTGWNVTFSSVDKLKSFAGKALAPAHAARIASINASETRLIETARAIRDFIAHQSAGSKKRMNEALTTVSAGHHNAQLGRGVHEIQSVGSYLKAVHDGQRRLHRYAAGLLAVSAHM